MRKRAQRFGRYPANERERKQIAIVEERGRFGDAGLARGGDGASMISVSGVMATEKIAPSEDS
jgi:hypothetical protein